MSAPRRRLPQVGDYGVTKGVGLAMWFVRWGTFARYGHAAIVVEVDHERGRVLVVEAMPSGARLRWVDPADWAWSSIPLTKTQRSTIVNEARRLLGARYDWRSILGFLVRFWGVKVKGRSDDHADNRVICSELVVWCYLAAGIVLIPDVAPGDVSPGDLADLMTRNG